MKENIERWLGTIFGLIFVGLSLLVAVETLSRKLFNYSLQGADELGGYSLAVGATIAFSVALIGRTHVRVDVLHDRFPRTLQAVLNWLSIVLLAAFALLIAWLALQVIVDTRAYRSVAQSPWATPLVYPQGAWFLGLALFAAVATGFAIRATALLASGRLDALNRDFHPRGTKEELQAELASIAARGRATASQPAVEPTAGVATDPGVNRPPAATTDAGAGR